MVRLPQWLLLALVALEAALLAINYLVMGLMQNEMWMVVRTHCGLR